MDAALLREFQDRRPILSEQFPWTAAAEEWTRGRKRAEREEAGCKRDSCRSPEEGKEAAGTRSSSDTSFLLLPAILGKPFRREARNPPKIDSDTSSVRRG